MREILIFLILMVSFGFQAAQAQDDPPLDELEVEAELVEDDYDEEEMDEGPTPEPRRPPAPTNRFRNSSKRFGGGKKSFGRKGRSGGGEDRLGKTEGKIKFELANPPKYYKRKNRPYVMPPKN